MASEKQREAEVADAVAAIRELAYPYFAVFDDVAAVRARLICRGCAIDVALLSTGLPDVLWVAR